MSITGKEAQANISATTWPYSSTSPDGLVYRCRDWTEHPDGDSLIVANLSTVAESTQAGYSQLTAMIQIDGIVVANQYDVAQQNGGGFVTSTAATETIKGNMVHTIRLCVASRGVNAWRVTYSLSIIG